MQFRFFLDELEFVKDFVKEYEPQPLENTELYIYYSRYAGIRKIHYIHSRVSGIEKVCSHTVVFPFECFTSMCNFYKSFSNVRFFAFSNDVGFNLLAFRGFDG